MDKDKKTEEITETEKEKELILVILSLISITVDVNGGFHTRSNSKRDANPILGNQVQTLKSANQRSASSSLSPPIYHTVLISSRNIKCGAHRPSI